ncbi:aldehyde dehydrogenase family protein [Haliea sp. E17]|uniref:aldehyde dehydrogenase family protein n=1 Tax=Haliea sp. E17 TaxID=3401576 RepID=UPI003AAD10AF
MNQTQLQAPRLPALRNHIDGVSSAPEFSNNCWLQDPNDLRQLQQQLSSSPAQIESALAAAQRAYQEGDWEAHTPAQRAELLESIADHLATAEIAEQMAVVDALTTGAVIKVTRLMASLVPLVFRGAAAHLRNGALHKILPGKLGDIDYFRSPWGPALLISPWNGPTAIGSHKIASALAAGAPCIIKPSEWAPHSTLLMAEAIAKVDLPRGTFQLLCGDREVGAAMVGDPRIRAISFTGGVAGGRSIAAATAEDFKPLQLELGGNNPLIVFEDADLDLAARGVVYGLSNMNAQWCRALGRLLVHRSIKAPLLERVSELLSALKLGHSLDAGSDMGPLIHEQQYRGILTEIERLQSLGGRVIAPTPLPDLPGYFVAPTLVDDCAPEQSLQENFGPVACIHSFDSEEEALALANGTAFGLAAYVYSADERRARAFSRKIRCGGVKINGYSLLALSGTAPRSAWGLSGLGEEGAAQSIRFFTGARVVGLSPQDQIGGSSAR